LSKEKKITLSICFSIYAIIILFILGSEQGYNRASDIGTTGFLLGVTYFFLSLILMIPKQTRKVGIAVLLSSGIIFLIGLSVCSRYPIKLNFILTN
jgi:hypothetical protein